MKRLISAAATAAALLAGTSASALTTFTLNVPNGLNYGTVSLTDGGDYVDVSVTLSAGYNFVDTGSHSAFAFSVAGTGESFSQLAPSPGYAISASGNYAQSGFGTFEYVISCSACQGQNNSATPDDVLSFRVSRVGISESDFTANGDGFYFSADVYGPGANGRPATFPVGANTAVTPIPEPETYALMLAGLGVLGYVSSRRKQR